MPTRLHLFNVLKRVIRVSLKLEKRNGTSNDKKEAINYKFLKWILNWNRSHRKKMFAILESIKDRKVVITNNPRKLNIEKLLNINSPIN